MIPNNPNLVGGACLLAGVAGFLTHTGQAPEAPSSPDEIWFEEVAASAGLAWSHESGAEGNYWFPEIMGGGCAFLDYDGDGFLDVYLVQSGHLKPTDDKPSPPNKLFRNKGDGTFEDVTEATGVGDTGYGMGVACGDFDQDGDVDMYVTNVGPNVMYRNNGKGKFTDETVKLKARDDRWGTSVAFVDVDGDDDLDIFIVNNLSWSEKIETPCTNYRNEPDYCSPNNYNAQSTDALFTFGRLGFTSATKRAGIQEAMGNGLGVAVGDYDQDGDMDIYVANDATANVLWQNNGKGVFTNVALEIGCAFNSTGTPEAGMGVQFVDPDADGDLDLFMTHLRRESNTFYRNRRGRFSDVTPMTGMIKTCLEFTGFGMGFHDFDLDGKLDLYVVNGAVQKWEQGKGWDENDPYAEPNHLYKGSGGVRFDEVPGAGLAAPLLGTSRGAAFGDYDNDGDVDVLYVDRDANVKLLRNVAERQGHWVGFRVLRKKGRNPRLMTDAVGAMVGVTIGDKTHWRTADPAYSYLSSNDPRVHFGLGDQETVTGIQVRWPDGTKEAFAEVAADAYHTLRRGEGTPIEDK